MTTQTTDITFEKSALKTAFDAVLNAIGRGIRNYMHQRSRVDQIEALQAKSDAELERMGVARDDIARYVFRDTFYI
ncbi:MULTISPECIES: hypothetical protein [Sediminimonas]|uniref:hypothetical protein n=1 Tax=Sediminimonas TaxID=659427 RepID=UPI00040706DE|nr:MULTISPECIES: hypothetical protein [Sediminimonas]MDR9484566.1 hypothetical protein [Sediminimonas sp.]